MKDNEAASLGEIRTTGPEIDDPYTFGAPTEEPSETSPQEFATPPVGSEEIASPEQPAEEVNQDQPFYTKYGFNSEAELKAALDKANNADNQLNQLFDKVAQIEQRFVQPEPEPEIPQPMSTEEFKKKFADDPEGALIEYNTALIRHELANAPQPEESDETKVTNMMMQAITDPNMPDFKDLIPQISEHLSAIPNLEDHIENPLLLQNAYLAVKTKQLASATNKQPANKNGIIPGKSAGSEQPQPAREVSYDTMFAPGSDRLEYVINLANGKIK